MLCLTPCDQFFTVLLTDMSCPSAGCLLNSIHDQSELLSFDNSSTFELCKKCQSYYDTSIESECNACSHVAIDFDALLGIGNISCESIFLESG